MNQNQRAPVYNEHAFLPLQEITMDEFRELQVRARRFILHAVSEKSRVPLHKLLVRGVEPDRDQVQSDPFQIVGQVVLLPGTNPEGWTHTVAVVPDASGFGTTAELALQNNPVADDRGFVSYGIQDNGQIFDEAANAPVANLFPPGVTTVEFLSGAGTRVDQWDLRPLWSYVNSALGFQGIAQKLFAYVHQDEMIVNHKYTARFIAGDGIEHPYRMAVAEKYGKFIGVKT